MAALRECDSMFAGNDRSFDPSSRKPGGLHARACAVLAAFFLTLVPCGLHAQSTDDSSQRRIIVAIAERSDPAPMVGSTSRGYSGLRKYSGSERTLAASALVADDHELTEVAAWTIDPLGIRCMLYEIAPGSQREYVLDRLQKDRRVHLAQPLQEFGTQSSIPGKTGGTSNAVPDGQFNDPYVALQSGFVSIGAAQAQRLAIGENVHLAVIDTGIDATHPDLIGRISEQRDFVAGTTSHPGLERHGTEIAGVIAAVANNGIGIVGVAPGVSVHSYRACWPAAAGASAARCNSFTLAQALAAAIEARTQIINLSLGGPHDPLLEQLLGVAFKRGIIVVGATPTHGKPEGFPSGVSGVIAVSSSAALDGSTSNPVLSAPGDQILTLVPGGSYDYASGSSLATAHVAGTIALLLQLSPALDAPALTALLRQTSRTTPGQIDACAAVHSASGDKGSCVQPKVRME
jgi:subtilisin family serine protease